MSFDNDNRSFVSLGLVVRRNQFFQVTQKNGPTFLQLALKSLFVRRLIRFEFETSPSKVLQRTVSP